jgi:pimeloyl-ACP methyl ester carboxylesterase
MQFPDPAARFCRLPDGRRLAYAEYGAHDGYPLFYCHGFPGSHPQIHIAHATATRLNLRLIAADRPGIGQSDFQPGRRLGDWPGDVAALADALGLARFAMLGVSGGGPYALACAHKLGQRLDLAAVVCGLGPLDVPDLMRGMNPFVRFQLRLAGQVPLLGRLLAYANGWQLQHLGSGVYPLIQAALPPADQAIMQRPQVAAAIIHSVREALCLTLRGAVHELEIYNAPWDFSLAEIQTPVYLWHGEADNIVPVDMGRYLAQRIPACQAHFCPDQGHYSLAFGLIDEVLETIASQV